MADDFNPNLNVENPLAEFIEAENTLREFGAATAAMEFEAEQDEAVTEAITKEEEAHTLSEHEQILQDRIAELEAQLASQKALNASGAAQATITSTGVNDDCSEIVDAEPIGDAEPADDATSADPGETALDWDALEGYLEPEPGQAAAIDAEPEQPAEKAPAEPQVPMVTLEHRIPRPTKSAWEPAVEDVIRVKVPKATVFPNPAQPFTVAEHAIALPEGIAGNYQIANTRAMLSENTVYVTWRQAASARPNSWF